MRYLPRERPRRSDASLRPFHDLQGLHERAHDPNSALPKKSRDLLKRCERALGEENVVTFETFNLLACVLQDNGEYEEARKVWERCLAGRTKVLGEDHKQTLDTLMNLGIVYDNLGNSEKALEYFERSLQGFEKTMGKNHPQTLHTLENMSAV